MPNHTSNRLVVTGSAKLISEIKKFVKGKELFDCNKIIPMPKDLEGTRSPTLIETPEKIVELNKKNEITRQKWAKEHPDAKDFSLLGDELAITQEEYDRRLKVYGCSNWYDWSIKNWGTKWGTYSVGKWSKSGKDAVIQFKSAWSPPLPVIATLAEKFPKATFVLQYADEGGGFLGSTTFEDGGKSGETNLEWRSKGGIKLRKVLDAYYEEVEDEA